MFKRVENELEFAMFNGIWTTVWNEKGFEFEFSEEFLERYVVVTEEGYYVGSIEIKPYGEDSSMNEIGPFLEHPLIQAEMGNIAEIDKLAILSTYRGDMLLIYYQRSFIMQRKPDQLLCHVAGASADEGITHLLPCADPESRWQSILQGEDVIPSIVNARSVHE